ncbi:SDR family oxidoreductase [Gordonia sp. TBRC 11910]|uniref:SDR family oxidoreductase n=1 Tax=Gordonia asplenii TaxID=2725283 RepID=A0A848L0W3_9ACTN|nr:SDR family oxidoreductase [Gordonia asplenii]NMO02141.1 SDR family oxidoreductase [Gordonia asplenii]
MTLAGKVAVVAGASRGIGLAVTYALAGRGVSVVVNGRDPDAVAETVTEITGGGGFAVGVVGSAADDGVAETMVTAALDHFGALDIAVNCAGIAEPDSSTVLTITPTQFREQIEAHLVSSYQLLHSAGKHFADQRSGAIVLTGSAASTGIFGGSGYPAGKGGVNALALAAGADLREFGVRVNVVMPGARSRLSTGAEYISHIEELHRRGLLDAAIRDAALDPAPAEYVAALYVYLASDRAASTTGQIYTASGGFIGRYDAATPKLVAYRDHRSSPPYTQDELAEVLDVS